MVHNPSRREAFKLAVGMGIATSSNFLFPSDASAMSGTGDITHGLRSRSEIALTFHGQGEVAIAAKLLEIGKKTSTPLTVMAVGTWLDANPDMGRKILASGNEMGNHTYSHKTMTRLTLKEATSEIQKGKAALIRSIGTPSKWFRPSGTPKSNSTIRAAVKTAGYARCITYDVDSLDYQDPAPQVIVANCLRTAQNGSIISLHFGHPHTVIALPLLIKALNMRGLTPVTLSQLLRS